MVCCNSFPVLVCPMVSILSFSVFGHLSIAFILALQQTCFIYFPFCPVSVLVFCARTWSLV